MTRWIQPLFPSHLASPLLSRFPMAPKKSTPSQPQSADSGDAAKLIQCQDFDREAARLCSLSSALQQSQDTKFRLKQMLEPLIKVQTESLSWLNRLDEMRQKVEARKLVMRNLSLNSKCAAGDSEKQAEQLRGDVESLLVAGSSLSVAIKKLQEENRFLSRERKNGKFRSLQKILRKRQQYMISQVSLLYPVKASFGQGHELELESFPSCSRSGDFADSQSFNQGALRISGLQLTMFPFTKLNFFTDKESIRKSATALGYVAHAVSLIASYLEVPLRYPLRLGGSHSYIKDPAPSSELNLNNSSSEPLLSTNLKPVEFSLFLEGQDATKTAYAVFLLNKDLEQLLNFVDQSSLGPHHVLPNLRELLRTIQSSEYIYIDR